MESTMVFMAGILLAIMIQINGELASVVGNNMGILLIHFTGFVIICLGLLIKKIKIKYSVKLPFYFYLTGFLGVVMIGGNSLTFREIGISSTIALGLTGQIVFSMIIDYFGLFKREKVKVNKNKIVSLMLIFIGIYFVV